MVALAPAPVDTVIWPLEPLVIVACVEAEVTVPPLPVTRDTAPVAFIALVPPPPVFVRLLALLIVIEPVLGTVGTLPFVGTFPSISTGPPMVAEPPIPLLKFKAPPIKLPPFVPAVIVTFPGGWILSPGLAPAVIVTSPPPPPFPLPPEPAVMVIEPPFAPAAVPLPAVNASAVAVPEETSGVLTAPRNSREPLLATLAWLVPFTCRSSRFPANPLAALTPRPVPLVLQAVDVAPLGSIRNWGLVVVAVPPVNHVPVKVPGGADAAPFRLLIKRPLSVTFVPSVVSVLSPAYAPALL
jgi:hypothetical protein